MVHLRLSDFRGDPIINYGGEKWYGNEAGIYLDESNHLIATSSFKDGLQQNMLDFNLTKNGWELSTKSVSGFNQSSTYLKGSHCTFEIF